MRSVAAPISCPIPVMSAYQVHKKAVDLPDGRIFGTTRGLNPDGYLIVRKDDGTDTLVLAGGVRAARA